jgi:plasmid maintenance system killer protein
MVKNNRSTGIPNADRLLEHEAPTDLRRAEERQEGVPKDVAELLPQRLVVLAAFRCLKDIPRGTPLHFHPLRENWAGHFAARIDKKYRIVFKPCGEFERLPDGTPDLATVTEIEITAVEDYHDA